MTKYELSLSPNYVPSWTIVDAVRELFQNAIDQEATVEGNTMFYRYHKGQNRLEIGNRLSVLNPRSLLLGATTKADDPKTIGKFGEGYKIASLVLTRLGKKVEFLNYGAREVWYPRFSKSRKYDTIILVFDVNKAHVWKSVPNNNLTINIHGITAEEMELIVDSNLLLQHEYNSKQTKYGRVLLDGRHKGKVFVNGLYVCEHKPYTYGYDFKPSLINLDRDRKLANSFDLEWLASKVWLDSDDTEIISLAIELIKQGAADVRYLHSNSYLREASYSTIANGVHESFVGRHGKNAVPVTSQEEMELVPDTHKPVIVSEQEKVLVVASPEYVAPEPETRGLRGIIQEWLDTNRQSLSKKAINDMEEIIRKVDVNVKI